jgi:hypothetical protein
MIVATGAELALEMILALEMKRMRKGSLWMDAEKWRGDADNGGRLGIEITSRRSGRLAGRGSQI